MARLKEHYQTKLISELKETLKLDNIMEVPRIEKITLNMGVGDSTQDSRRAQRAADDLTLIAGQKAIVTYAKKSIAGFKVRENMPLGCKVTLRRAHMYEFMDRLINIAMPRIRDFRGISAKSFDGHGNYSMGIKEHIIFPEIDYDKVESIRGMDIVFCTTANTDDEAHALLSELNMPFKK